MGIDTVRAVPRVRFTESMADLAMVPWVPLNPSRWAGASTM